MRRAFLLAVIGAALVAGCSWGEPERLEILVATTPPGASCLLIRAGQKIATVDPTPAIALVDPHGPDIAVHCRRPGFADAEIAVPAGASSDHQRLVEIALQPPGPQALLPPR